MLLNSHWASHDNVDDLHLLHRVAVDGILVNVCRALVMHLGRLPLRQRRVVAFVYTQVSK